MSILPVGFGSSGGIDVGDIANSLRFRSSASAYLSRTFGTPSSATIWTYKFDLKQGTMPSGGSSVQQLLVAVSGSASESIYIDGNGKLVWLSYNGTSTTFSWTSTATFRDPSAFHSITMGRNGTSYFVYKGSENISTAATVTGALNAGGDYINKALTHYIGRNSAGTVFGDQYLARLAFVDNVGTANTSFGYLNTSINEWVSKSQSAVKAVVDAGGTNSFMLDFDDATSTTTLGYDKSSKGNNWTCNNISLTAGTTYDHMLDVPGNSYATLNPLDKTSTGMSTLSDGNLNGTSASNTQGAAASTIAVSSGKWFVEVEFSNSAISDSAFAGITYTSGGGRYYSSSGKYWDGSAWSAVIWNTYTTSDVVGVAINLDSGNLSFYKNGTLQGTKTIPVAECKFWVTSYISGGVSYSYANFGQAPLHASATYDSASGGYFRYAPPTGFKALCQANLPDPAILNPEKHFDVKTHTGNSGTQSITGVAFQPDLAWVKCRGTASTNHHISDVLRGATLALSSSLTAAEINGDTAITSFNSDGISLGANTNGYSVNENTKTYVDWLWKANGSGSSNTDGSITSTVSANTEAGFSIVTYAGSASNVTVGHGLGVAPKMVIVKNRDGTNNWHVWHTALAGTEYLILDLTNAKTTDATKWNSTIPTSTVFSLGTNAGTNTNTNKYIAYCFAEIPGYSKFGSYTGNNVTLDGTYVHCGFKPKWIMCKNINVSEDWLIMDAARPGYNVIGGTLWANLALNEDTTVRVDFTSQGFKFRVASTGAPNTANTYIFAAFADVPGKYSLAR